MTQILNHYDEKYFTLYWLGDFLNSKLPHTSDKEVEYVIHMMLERCYNVLHSNHMHILFQYLHYTVMEPHDHKIMCHWKGWRQTERVVNSLHPSTRRNIYKFIEGGSDFVKVIHVDDLKILCAHSSPKAAKNRLITTHLSENEAITIGMKNPGNFWKQKDMRELIDKYDYVVVGHHGFISRLGNVRINDMRGIQVPTWNPITDEFKLFPQ